jgi:YidC/Oxa1 family membrane protein insertase
MEKRAIIAVVISVAILLIYQEVVLKHFYPPAPFPTEFAPEAEPTPPELPAPAGAVASPPEEMPALASGGRDLIVETELYRAVLNTAGGRLTGFQLKQYRTAVAPDSPPQEMVQGHHNGDSPLRLQLRGAQDSVSDVGLVYTPDRDGLILSGANEGSLTLTAKFGEATVTKTFAFRGDQYLIGLDLKVDGGAAYQELGVAWDKTIEATAPGAEVIFEHVSYLQAKKLLHEAFDQLGDGKVIEKGIQWAGYDGRYFLSALVPPEGDATRLWLKRRNQTVEMMLLVPRSEGRLAAHVDVYVGPKEVDTLDAAGHSLVRAVDLGYFDFIARPLLYALRLSNRVTGNYGVDIILLTVVIKILFIPLTQRSFQSMKAMQKLQPQMQKIRERYKDTPEQMNKEIMELYRRHKVNPLGGCLPMVVQLPVFFGLYSALSSAFELRHAPFIWWITDLSAPDRLGTLPIPFITPPGIPVLTLFMGASMFVQQWMTPTTGDPQQQRIMMLMPIMFTFMFVSFPAGLTLYWLVNNVLTIGQQYVINRPERRHEESQ